MMTQEVQVLKRNDFHFSSLIVYSDGTVEQIPPGIFQSTCKVKRQNLDFLYLDMVQRIAEEILILGSWCGSKQSRYSMYRWT